MEVYWDLNELDRTLLLNETMAVDETFEELEQSILSILSEEDSEVALSPKTNSQNIPCLDFKNRFNDPVANDENKSQLNSPIISFKEKGLKRQILDSVTDCRPSGCVTKRAKISLQPLDGSPTSRSPRKILTTLNQKENFTLLSDSMHADRQSTTERGFNKNLNSPLKISDDRDNMSGKLPLKPKNYGEHYDTLKMLNFNDTISMSSPKRFIPCLPYSVTDITVIGNINDQNKSKLPKYTQLVLPSSKDNSNRSLNLNNPPSHKSFLDLNENNHISAECDKVSNVDSQMNEQGQIPTINDSNKSIPKESYDISAIPLPCVQSYDISAIPLPSVQSNEEVHRRDADLQTSEKDIIQEQSLNTNSQLNENAFELELPHKSIPNSNSFTSDASFVEDDDLDVLSLFAEDDSGIIDIEIDETIDEDALLDTHENTDDDLSDRNEVQTLEEIEQTDTSVDHPESQFSHKIPSSSQTISKNVDLAGDDKNASFCKVIKTPPADSNFETSPQIAKNNSFKSDDSNQDELNIFVVEELKFDYPDTNDTEDDKNVEDHETVNDLSEKCKDNLKVILPVTENKTTIESYVLKSTTASIKYDKTCETSSIPKAEVDVQNLKKLKPEVSSEVAKQLSENTQIENATASESTTQVKKVFKPFKSADPDENKDIDHPEWEHMKKLTTDEERYQDVRSRWKSKTVPNPNRDLTYHSFRKHRVQADPVSDSNVKQGQKRMGDNSLKKPAAKRTRTKTVPCTYLIDDKIRRTRQQFSIDTQTVKATYAVGSQSLYAMRENAESQLVARMHDPYYNFQPYNQQDYNNFHLLASNHNNVENALLLECKAQMQAVQSSHDLKLNSLNNARQEIEKFCKFYKGLSHSADGESDPTVITENQMEELNEMENVFLQFNNYYKR